MSVSMNTYILESQQQIWWFFAFILQHEKFSGRNYIIFIFVAKLSIYTMNFFLIRIVPYIDQR